MRCCETCLNVPCKILDRVPCNNQSERDKVLDELYNWYKEKDKIILSDHRIPLWELEHKIAELRQQAGER
jgi:hypothetical protein